MTVSIAGNLYVLMNSQSLLLSLKYNSGASHKIYLELFFSASETEVHFRDWRKVAVCKGSGMKTSWRLVRVGVGMW